MPRVIIDLAQPQGYGETSITIDKITHEDSKTKNLPENILSEINFNGDILTRGCLLEKDAKNINEYTSFDSFKIGMFYIPKDFKYVPCTFNNNNGQGTVTLGIISPDIRTKDILCPLVINLRKYPNEQEKANQLKISHHCDSYRIEKPEKPEKPENNYRVDKDYSDGDIDTIREGCLSCIRSLHDATDFILFYYNGYINLPENQDKVDGEFYFIPLSLSCGTTVYYVIRIKVNGHDYLFQEQLNWFYSQLLKNPSSNPGEKYADSIVAKSPIRYDDHLAVLLVSHIYFEDI